MKKKAKLSTFKLVWQYIKHYRFLIFLTLIFALGVVSLTVYVPVLIGRCIDLIAEAGHVDFAGISSYGVKIAVIVGITAILQGLMDFINNKITYQVSRDIRNDAFIKIQSLPLKYIDSHAHGDIMSRIVADVDQFSDGLLLGFTHLFSGVLTIIGILAFMLAISPAITLLVVVLTPLSLFAANFIARRTYDMFRVQTSIHGEQTAFLDEIITGQKVVQAFSQEQEIENRFEEINSRLEKASLRAIFFSSTTFPTTRFVNGLVYAAVAFLGSFMVISGGVTVGGLSAFLSYANQYTKPFNEISGVVAELQNALACAGRIFELLSEESQSPDKDDALALRDTNGNVAVEHVYFSYSPGQKLIQDFNLTVSPGQRIAIVGPTGCGKTSMINLLMRFYEVNSGTISVDGNDIRDITRESLRKSFGMVLQDTWLREGTVHENITMGRPHATREEVIAACKATRAHSFIKQLPNGYDTPIGNGGSALSQGQQQMLCIARVMLCMPPMLILDEATSSIDTRTEILIQEAFVRLMQGRTSFIVAHRLSTIKSADIILVMRGGNVVEKGSHDQLIKKDGFYAELYKSQFAV